MTPKDLRQTLGALAAELRDEHPLPTILRAYSEQELPPEDFVQVRSHLAVCPECARAILDMADFPEIEPMAGDRVAAIDLDEELRRVTSRLESASAPTSKESVPIPFATKPRATPSLLRKFLPLAAMAALALGAVGFMVRLERQTESYRQELLALREAMGREQETEHSFEIMSLIPAEAGTTRGIANISPAAATAQARALPVILNLYPQPGSRDYRAQLLDASGVMLKSWNALAPTSKKNFTIFLPSYLLLPGRYEIRLIQKVEGQEEIVTRFPFEISE